MLYSVLLGDATLTNMTLVPPTGFENSAVYLRVWFDDGANGSQPLSPDQRIVAVGYAMMAANLDASGQSGVPTGGVVLSPTENAALVNAGYLRIGAITTAPDQWAEGDRSSAPLARRSHTAVWTGTEMIVWGGFGGGFLNDGARYNPNTDTWRAINSSGAPAARNAHSAVWTGTEMIVWGDGTTRVWTTADATIPLAIRGPTFSRSTRLPRGAPTPSSGLIARC